MQNNCNCGCQPGSGCQQNFVPVNGNWDFNNGNGDCGHPMRRRRSNGCQQCGEREANYSHDRNKDCQCERCDDSREVECCDKNTYVRQQGSCRDMDHCGQEHPHSRSACGCKEGCTCDNCNRARNRRNDCDECGGGSNDNRSRSNDCDCEKDEATTYARSRKNRTVGMINVECQELDEIFQSESALRAGTLFPELHKPMNGYCPYDRNCGTCKQQAAFAAWELRLYLNTHPHDKEALELFRKLCKETEEPNYATTFLKDDQDSCGWNWVKNPWPWEYDCQYGD